MSQTEAIKINNFQIDNDGGLLLISEVDYLPFLVVDTKGVTFDAGPFAGAFCDLEGLSKFIVKGERDSACSVHLKFAEEDVYPMGGFHFSDKQYSEALRWVINANKRIAEKKEVSEAYPPSLTDAVISKIADHGKIDKKSLEPNTAISQVLHFPDSLGWQELILDVEGDFSIIVPESFLAEIETIVNVIEFVNAQVTNETDFPDKHRRKTENIRIQQTRTAEKLL
ncbi:MAG: acyl carrier protein [Candidatus Poribacteria bacterium]|nr:acyl carrier protein [Candidatus Poribacteria bacterium]